MTNIHTIISILTRRRVQISITLLTLIVYPFVVSDFFIFQIGSYSLILGTIALSLMVLAGYGGMVSLAQMTVAGIAGYAVAILGTNSAQLGLNLPLWIVVPCAIAIGSVVATCIGFVSVRTEGVYTIMITLAIAVVFFYLVRQNYAIFNGFNGFAGVEPPVIGAIYWRDPIPFYYLTLTVSTFFCWAVWYMARSPFGIALQAVRDNPRRMNALGFHVTAHRISAYCFSGVIASTAGVLFVWFNGRISPGSVNVDAVLNILIIAILGGLAHPIGPFLGAIIFVLLENFAIDFIARERFNTVIGVSFLLIVFLSPDGMLGIFQRIVSKIHAKYTLHGH